MARIYPKKDRTLEHYKQVGARVRLSKAAAVNAAAALGTVLTSDEYAKVRRALALFDEAVSKANDRMFRNHPWISGRDFTKVFYGCLGGETVSATDEEVRRLAREYADGLFA